MLYFTHVYTWNPLLVGAESLTTTVPWNHCKNGCFQCMPGTILALWLVSWENKSYFSSARCIRQHRRCIAASISGSSQASLAAFTWRGWDRFCPWDRSAAWVTLIVKPNHCLGAPVCTNAHHSSVRITNGSNPESKMAAWSGGHRFHRRELPFVVTFFGKQWKSHGLKAADLSPGSTADWVAMDTLWDLVSCLRMTSITPSDSQGLQGSYRKHGKCYENIKGKFIYKESGIVTWL